jgi:hypothetical protein
MPDRTQEVISEISHFITSPLSPKDYGHLIYPTEKGFVPRDHLTYLINIHQASTVDPYRGSRLNPYYREKMSYGSPKEDSKAVKDLIDPKSREAHILRRLGHIVVNPNDKFNTSAIVNSYCFVSDVKKSVGELPSTEIANLNPASAQMFLDRLIEMAQRQTEIMRIQHDRQGITLTQPKALLLHGQRGCGKTFFENFLLSKYSNYLDSKKVIWVRLNLVDSIGYDDKLVSWISAQSAKIILRYYNRLSRYFAKPHGMSVDVDEYMREKIYPYKNKRTIREIERSLDRAKEQFFNAGHLESDLSEQAISEEIIPTSLAEYVVAAARHSGFHFIVVLDGLDVLEITRAYQERFDKLITKSLELASTVERNGFSLVLVTRTNTLRMILRHDYQDTYEQTEMEEVTVIGVPLLKIVDLRLKNIERETAEMVKVRAATWRTDDIHEHIQEFDSFLHEKEIIHGRESDEKYITVLEDLQGDNVRAKMQMLQYKYFDFLMKRRTTSQRAPYHLVEALMKAGRRFPPIAYRYVSEKGIVLRAIWHRQKFDSRFFPSLFRFPFISGRYTRTDAHRTEGADLVEPQIDYVMVGVRILQMLRAMVIYYESHGQGSHELSYIAVDELCDYLAFAFNYDRGLVLRVLEEFSEYQVLEFHNPNMYTTGRRLEDCEILCLPKLDHLLNHFLYDIAYLNMAAMRIPLPPSAFTAKGEPYLQAASYDEVDDPLPLWVSAKITNVCGLLRLLAIINDQQQLLFARKMAQLGESESDMLRIFSIAEEKVEMFSFIYFLRGEATKQMYLALNGIHQEAVLNETVRRVRRYMEQWQSIA